MVAAIKTAVATKDYGSEVAIFGDNTKVPDWARNSAGRGSENVSSNDVVLPRLEIVQSQSPIKDENPNAKEGMLFNAATGDLIGDLAFIVPIYFRVEWVVWKDQEKGGGFFGAFQSMEEAEARLREKVAEGENEGDLEIVDTPVHFCLRVVPDANDPRGYRTEQIVISMAKSKSKVSRKWNAMIQIAGGDRFSRAYKVGTFKDKNKKDQKFYNYVIQPNGFPPEPVYREAEKVYEFFKLQNVSVNHGEAAEAGVGGDGPDRGGI